MHRLLSDLGVELPVGIELSEGPLPSSGNGIVHKDWGIVINIAIDLTLDPATVGAVGGSVAGIILAVSKFLKDCAHEPKVATVDDVVEVIGDDGRPRSSSWNSKDGWRKAKTLPSASRSRTDTATKAPDPWTEGLHCWSDATTAQSCAGASTTKAASGIHWANAMSAGCAMR